MNFIQFLNLWCKYYHDKKMEYPQIKVEFKGSPSRRISFWVQRTYNFFLDAKFWLSSSTSRFKYIACLWDITVMRSVIMKKIFKISFAFYVKQLTTGKVHYQVFKCNILFLSSVNIIVILRGRLGARLTLLFTCGERKIL